MQGLLAGKPFIEFGPELDPEKAKHWARLGEAFCGWLQEAFGVVSDPRPSRRVLMLRRPSAGVSVGGAVLVVGIAVGFAGVVAAAFRGAPPIGASAFGVLRLLFLVVAVAAGGAAMAAWARIAASVELAGDELRCRIGRLTLRRIRARDVLSLERVERWPFHRVPGLIGEGIVVCEVRGQRDFAFVARVARGEDLAEWRRDPTFQRLGLERLWECA
ncbi:MAG TPA: hypothetical protein RMH85_22865 [Polyangiaceae bacterium LLY-WYZ-15_(1-7)]|nr:hypothetical protein [Sandaracinus sp.]HJK90539.1 hypothetical protein [Polyangiaceae bacterium LLY-WYZ-15_(1-7)]HJL06406.1 hypothetical protein [Polyangiaceae bacterium LLY-WYZ-15_(1-7)]HJL11335.1 hypothetical protein [Polyangiaceae bacterium LLY-WYZ-15_(1-7)]HJL25776.1 hypothetical protein [Polyangiaceae bacterium LLY-WYZ-15_(1-7)]